MKPKIVLARCPIDDVRIAADQWNMPLDLLLLADAVDRRCDVEILDGTLLGPGLLDRLSASGAEVVGLTYTALSSKSLAAIATQAKKQGALVILGGQPATAASPSLALEPIIDAVCTSDGQPTIQVLSQQLADGAIDLHKVPNLLLRGDAGLAHTHTVLENVWEQIMPPRNFAGVEPERYLREYRGTNTLVNMSGQRAANLLSKRGCKRRCSFCARQDKGSRARNPAIVAQEIRYLLDSFGIDYTLDTSDTWVDEPWMAAFSHQRKEARIDGIKMMVFADARDITRDVALALASCGVDSVLLGIESGSERILRRNGKFISRRAIVQAVDDLVFAGIKVSCSFVLGLLDEDAASLEETVSLTRELHAKPGVLCYGNTIMPLMGSWLWKSTFPNDRSWPSFITRALDYDLEAARDLYISEATRLPGGRLALKQACEEILASCQLPVKEYAR
jgi:anaerobic magnesium-protoporphyrin IX monomethyl ester cyclase